MPIAITLRELHYMVAVADHGHFAKAAESCFVTQPTLSTQLKKLEDYLGVQIFERSKRGVMPTAAGEEIIAQARVVLAEAHKLVDVARQAADPYAGPLRLGVIPTLGPYLVPRVLPALRANYPQIKLYVREDLTRSLLQALKNGELDAALLAMPIREGELSVRSLFQEPFVLALPEAHPLLAKPLVDQADLLDQRLLLLDEGHCLRDQALSVCGHSQHGVDEDVRGTSLETLRQMVAAGIGVTLMPYLATERGVGHGNGGPTAADLVHWRTFAEPVPTREIGIVWRRSYTRASVIDAFCTLILEVIPASMRALEPRPEGLGEGRVNPVLTNPLSDP